MRDTREPIAGAPFKIGNQEYMTVPYQGSRCLLCCFRRNARTCVEITCTDHQRKDLKSVYFLPIDEYIKRRLKNEL